ncbi:MAG: Fur family transcriptional regulator [Pseudomonadota bacterium]
MIVTQNNVETDDNEYITELLRKVKLKITAPRIKVIQAMLSMKQKHATAADIHNILFKPNESLSLGTIYRVLNLLSEKKIVNRHRLGTDSYFYEFNRDSHHDHIVCLECGKIVEFKDTVIEERQNEIANKHGMKLRKHTMLLIGKCQDQSACEKGENI